MTIARTMINLPGDELTAQVMRTVSKMAAQTAVEELVGTTTKSVLTSIKEVAKEGGTRLESNLFIDRPADLAAFLADLVVEKLEDLGFKVHYRELPRNEHANLQAPSEARDAHWGARLYVNWAE